MQTEVEQQQPVSEAPKKSLPERMEEFSKTLAEMEAKEAEKSKEAEGQCAEEAEKTKGGVVKDQSVVEKFKSLTESIAALKQEMLAKTQQCNPLVVFAQSKDALFCLRDPALLEVMLKRGANVNVTDATGRTPLLFHLANDSPWRIIQLLLDNGADVTAVDSNDNCVFHLCRKPYEISRLAALCPLHVINQKNAYGETPLTSACKNIQWSPRAAALVKAGADLFVRTGREDTVFTITADIVFLEEFGTPENIRRLLDESDGKDMVRAAMVSNWELVDRMLAQCSRADFVDEAGRTILFYAKAGTVKRWIDKGINIHHKDNEGKTALMYVFDKGTSSSMVVDLLNHGAGVFSTPEETNAFVQLLTRPFSRIFDTQAIIRALVANTPDDRE